LSVLHQILAGGAERVIAAGAVVVGGHSIRDSEVKFGLAVTGVVEPARLLTNAAARPGDLLVLTKSLGTGFITTAAKAERCPNEVLESAIAAMIQLNSIGRDAAHAAGARGVTDVTGFGLAGHATEMATASQVTVVLHVDRFPELPGALALYRQGFKTRANKSNREFLEPVMRVNDAVDRDRLELAFDPQTSGGLLISVAPDRAAAVVQQVHDAGGAAAAVIGEVRERQDVSLEFRS
jgi:selenide,water dikinase